MSFYSQNTTSTANTSDNLGGTNQVMLDQYLLDNADEPPVNETLARGSGQTNHQDDDKKRNKKSKKRDQKSLTQSRKKYHKDKAQNAIDEFDQKFA